MLRFIIALSLIVGSISVLSAQEKQNSEPTKVNKSDFIDESALHDAVRAKDIEMVKFLISQKASIDLKDQFGYTPFHLAVRYHDIEIAKLLMAQGADIDTTDSYGDTPLIDAVRNNDTKIVKMLLCQKADRDVSDQLGMSALHYATKNRNLLLAKMLRVDYVELYCQDKIAITLDKEIVTSQTTPKICGDITLGYLSDISLKITAENGSEFAELKGEIDNEDHRWCVSVKQSLANGRYTLDIKGLDYVVNEAQAAATLYISTPIQIAIDKEPKMFYSLSPKICGDIKNGYAKDIEITLFKKLKEGDEDEKNVSFGPFKAQIDNQKKRWCATPTQQMQEGDYHLKVLGIDMQKNSAVDESDIVLKPAKIVVTIDEKELYIEPSPTICGDIKAAKAKKVELHISNIPQNEGGNIAVYGPYEAKIDNEQHRWCAKVADILPDDYYEAQVKATDIRDNSFIDQRGITVRSLLKLSIDPKDIYNDNTPKICGDIQRGDINSVELKLLGEQNNYGPYQGVIDQKKKRWCVDIQEEIVNGDYIIDVEGYDQTNTQARVRSDAKVYRIAGLYKALDEEFANDFFKWKAELDKDTLTFRFKDPSLLFSMGASDLKDRFKEILEDFFPRYIKIMTQYKGEIKSVDIEGHSSSEHSGGKTAEERFKLNLAISQKRADAVVVYLKSLNSDEVVNNKEWIENTFKSIGKSSSDLIYNLDGSENKELSRRVEFKIITK